MYEQIRRNRRASWLLMIFVVAILTAMGYVIGRAWTGSSGGGLGFLGLFGVVAIVWSLVGYYAGDRMVLAVSGAKQITHAEQPQLWNVVEEMTIAAGLAQPPAVYVIDDPAPNAFATGRDPAHSSIAVTRGLLEKLNRDELQGVVAHEMSHVRNYDIRFATLIGILVGLVALIADVFLRSRWFGFGGRRNDGGGGAGVIVMVLAIAFAILAPFAARIVQFAISRRRRTDAQSARARRGAAEDRRRPEQASRGQPRHGAPVYRQPSTQGQGRGGPVRHAPAHPGAHRPSARDGARRSATGAGRAAGDGLANGRGGWDHGVRTGVDCLPVSPPVRLTGTAASTSGTSHLPVGENDGQTAPRPCQRGAGGHGHGSFGLPTRTRLAG
jgi:heat shock protein HtpX